MARSIATSHFSSALGGPSEPGCTVSKEKIPGQRCILAETLLRRCRKALANLDQLDCAVPISPTNIVHMIAERLSIEMLARWSLGATSAESTTENHPGRRWTE